MVSGVYVEGVFTETEVESGVNWPRFGCGGESFLPVKKRRFIGFLAVS